MNFSSVIEQLIAKQNLSEQDSFAVMKEILSGTVPPASIAGFLVALRTKGETVDEIVGFVKAMREPMQKISTEAKVVLDTCGTGGDGKHTFNISTAAAFVAAGARVPVAKHGNRSISSQCGSADVLEALGVKIDMSKETAEYCLNEVGITFLFAPLYHPAMKNVADVRKELGIRTIFNILGPLLNPASANAQVIGVPRKELVPLMSKVLLKLNYGIKSCAMVIHEDGYDECVLSSKTLYTEIFKNKIHSIVLTPKKLGLKKIRTDLLTGGNTARNAQVLRDVLFDSYHPLREVVIANAAFAITCAQSACDAVADGFLSNINFLRGAPIKGAPAAYFKDAVEKARQSLSSGAAFRKLKDLIEYSNS